MTVYDFTISRSLGTTHNVLNNNSNIGSSTLYKAGGACSPTSNASSTLEATELEEDNGVLDKDKNEAEDCCPIRKNRLNEWHVPRDAK